MKFVRTRKRAGLAAFAALAALAPAGFAQDTLENGFRNPPASARPHTWWHWINGNASREGITADLEAMKRAGIGGAQIFNVDVGIPAGNTPFMGPKWLDLTGHAIREAGRLGIEICIHNCAGWSSSGGPWIKPEHAMQILVWTETRVPGARRFDAVLGHPPTRVGYYRDVAVLAFRTPAPEMGAPGKVLRIDRVSVKAAFERGDGLLPDLSPTSEGGAIPQSGVVDLTGRMDAAGHLVWDAPEGDWTVLRIGHTPTGKDNHPAPVEGRGLECDKLSREALDAHWNGMMAAVIKEAGPLAGRVLNNALIDSYEVGSQNWTPKFREEFRRRRGYDPIPFLPVVAGRVVGSIATSERFLWDFRRTIADLFADNYFGYFAQRCRALGMQFSTEPYGNGTFDNLQVGGLADIPMGEFWIGGAASETVKLAASAAHTHGRSIVGAEAFTADENRARWLADPYSIKALGDRMFAEGVSRYIFHRYAHQPWLNLLPGMTMGPWGMNLERTVTWWDQGSAWLRYVARCQHLLQSGRFVADVCYYRGEEAPNDLPTRRNLRPELPEGYDYDGCDATTLGRMSVQNGWITLPEGMRYRLLVLPESAFMTPAIAAKVRDLVRAGATVVGPKPTQSPSLSGFPGCDAQVRAIAAEVWANCDGKTVKEYRYGAGRVVWGRPLPAILAGRGVGPDFAFTSLSAYTRLVSIHRTTGNADIYFVSNQRYGATEAECAFRVTGKVPEIWHPDTGRSEPAPFYRGEKNRTVVPLRLDPAGSVFVIFRRPANGGDHWTSIARTGPGVLRSSAPRITIRKAFYEAADGSGVGADVTAKVAGLVAAGQFIIPAENGIFGDPVQDVVKRLRVEYVLNGKTQTRTVAENESLELAEAEEESPLPAFEIATNERGAPALVAWKPGVYIAQSARGRSVRVSVAKPADTLAFAGPWSLRFPPNWGAPPRVRLDRLISWSEHPESGVRYFSGTAEYETTFTVSAAMAKNGRSLSLDLGRVKNLAEVRLNGQNLGVLWKAPFRIDVSGRVKPGKNTLVVRVTNLWPNRLIGDAQLPEEVTWNGNALREWPEWLVKGEPRPNTGRYTFTTWRTWTKDSPLLPSGLLGPVTLRSAAKIVLR